MTRIPCCGYDRHIPDFLDQAEDPHRRDQLFDRFNNYYGTALYGHTFAQVPLERCPGAAYLLEGGKTPFAEAGLGRRS